MCQMSMFWFHTIQFNWTLQYLSNLKWDKKNTQIHVFNQHQCYTTTRTIHHIKYQSFPHHISLHFNQSVKKVNAWDVTLHVIYKEKRNSSNSTPLWYILMHTTLLNSCKSFNRKDKIVNLLWPRLNINLQATKMIFLIYVRFHVHRWCQIWP